MNKNLLIVGVDPGTTLGYALLDVDGNVVKIKSSKLLDLNILISEIIEKGAPIMIGTDRKDTPQFIDKLGAKIGARVITPYKDMPVGYKKALTKDFEKEYKNDHERDALASAVYAFKQIRSLISKIDDFIEKNKKQNFREDLINIVLRNDMPLSLALEVLESPEKKENRIIKKAIDKKIFDKDFLELYETLKRSQKENRLLKEHNEKLKKRLKETEQKIGYIQKKIEQLEPDEKAQKQLRFKEERIVAMGREIGARDEKIKHLTNEVDRINELISNSGGNVLVKKLKNLGTKEFESKKKLLNIREGDILFVEDLDVYSEKITDWLKNKISVIIFKNKANRKIKDEFILMDSKNLGMRENENFAIVDKKQFEKEKAKVGILDKIINDYKKERH